MTATVPYEQLTEKQLIGILRARDSDVAQLTESNAVLVEKLAQIQNILDKFLDKHEAVERSLKQLREGSIGAEVKIAALTEKARSAENERDTLRAQADDCDREVRELRRERDGLLSEIRYHQERSAAIPPLPPPVPPPNHRGASSSNASPSATAALAAPPGTFRYLGLQVREGSPSPGGGVIVERVSHPATTVGLREGDTLQFASVHKEYPISCVADYKRLVDELMEGGSVAIEGWRQSRDGGKRPVEYTPFTPAVGHF